MSYSTPRPFRNTGRQETRLSLVKLFNFVTPQRAAQLLNCRWTSFWMMGHFQEMQICWRTMRGWWIRMRCLLEADFMENVHSCFGKAWSAPVYYILVWGKVRGFQKFACCTYEDFTKLFLTVFIEKQDASFRRAQTSDERTKLMILLTWAFSYTPPAFHFQVAVISTSKPVQAKISPIKSHSSGARTLSGKM